MLDGSGSPKLFGMVESRSHQHLLVLILMVKAIRAGSLAFGGRFSRTNTAAALIVNCGHHVEHGLLLVSELARQKGCRRQRAVRRTGLVSIVVEIGSTLQVRLDDQLLRKRVHLVLYLAPQARITLLTILHHPGSPMTARTPIIHRLLLPLPLRRTQLHLQPSDLPSLIRSCRFTGYACQRLCSPKSRGAKFHLGHLRSMFWARYDFTHYIQLFILFGQLGCRSINRLDDIGIGGFFAPRH